MLVSIRHYPAARQALGSVLLAPGPELLTASWDGNRHTWEQWPHKPARPTEFARGEKGVGQGNSISGLALANGGRILACACTTGRVLVYRSQCPVTEVVVEEKDELQELQANVAMGDFGEFYLTKSVTLAGVGGCAR